MLNPQQITSVKPTARIAPTVQHVVQSLRAQRDAALDDEAAKAAELLAAYARIEELETALGELQAKAQDKKPAKVPKTPKGSGTAKPETTA